MAGGKIGLKNNTFSIPLLNYPSSFKKNKLAIFFLSFFYLFVAIAMMTITNKICVPLFFPVSITHNPATNNYSNYTRYETDLNHNFALKKHALIVREMLFLFLQSTNGPLGSGSIHIYSYYYCYFSFRKCTVVILTETCLFM